MKWKKIGRIDLSKWVNKNSCITEFATLPTPLLVNSEIIRVFVGFCNKDNIGSISYVDLYADNPSVVVNVSDSPVLFHGANGCFDDNGVVPLSVVQVDNKIYLYYVGFQLGVKVPYFMFGGLAVSSDNGLTFEKVSNTPVLERTGNELFARCGMFVMKAKNSFKMWYIGSTGGGGPKVEIHLSHYIQ